MNKAVTLICATVALGLMPVSQAAEKLPDFASKVQLHNCGGADAQLRHIDQPGGRSQPQRPGMELSHRSRDRT